MGTDAGTAGGGGTDAGAAGASGNDAGAADHADTDAGTEGPPCNARLTFEWSIETYGTVTPRTCASAGAAQFVVIVNGVSRPFPCPAGSSSGSFDVGFGTSGLYDVQLDLVDSSNVILSATATTPMSVYCFANSVPVIMDVN